MEAREATALLEAEHERRTWSVPAGVGVAGGAFADDRARSEAARHLVLLPGDDEWEEALDTRRQQEEEEQLAGSPARASGRA